MEMLCPECLGTLVSDDGQRAKCSVHGGEFQILFSRTAQPAWSSSLTPAPPPIIAAAPGMCVQHSNLKAAFVCSACSQPICSLCAFPREDGSRICPACAGDPGNSRSGPRLVGSDDRPPPGIHALKCLQHPNVSAAQVCKLCGAPMCATCDFLLPGNLHVCPRCVADPPKRMTSRRKRLIVASYILAVWGTVGLVVFMSGLFASMGEVGLEVIFAVFLFIPALVGGALGISCIDRRLSNPPSVWGTAIWNISLLAIHILLRVVAQFRS